MAKKNLAIWTAYYLGILVGTFLLVIALPLYFGAPFYITPILILVAGCLSTYVRRRILSEQA
tara:strand:+ start:126576 stop:126761 length:186 start_codon:yes stop_codon:yes gene_type:complete